MAYSASIQSASTKEDAESKCDARPPFMGKYRYHDASSRDRTDYRLSHGGHKNYWSKVISILRGLWITAMVGFFSGSTINLFGSEVDKNQMLGREPR
jgi:hypothetical protein